MKITGRYIRIAAVLLAGTLITACERTELCYDHYPVAAISFNWEKEWERDYGTTLTDSWDAAHFGFDYDFLRPPTPEWVNLVKYRDDAPDGEHYFPPAGNDIILKSDGKYSFLFYNGDTEYIVLSDIASLPNARASATSRTRASMTYIMEKHPNVKSSNTPDILYSAFVENVPQIANHQRLPMPIKMQPLVFTYVVRYEFEYGLQHVYMARGALAGMAESVYLRDGRTSEDPIILLYDCELKDYGCEAHVKSFGVPGFPDEYYGRATTGDDDAPAERPYTLNLELMLTNGKTLEFNFDVADQIKSQPRGGVITVSGIRIEDEQNEPTTSGGGFDVDLSGWGQIDLDLPI